MGDQAFQGFKLILPKTDVTEFVPLFSKIDQYNKIKTFEKNGPLGGRQTCKRTYADPLQKPKKVTEFHSLFFKRTHFLNASVLPGPSGIDICLAWGTDPLVSPALLLSNLSGDERTHPRFAMTPCHDPKPAVNPG